MTERDREAAIEDRPGALARKIFAPAILILNRLKYLQKFILISACFAVPIAVSMYLLIDKNIHYWEDFTRKEAEGVQNISRIRKLLEDIQTHGALAMIFTAGDISGGDMLLSKESEIDEGLKKLNGLVESGALSGKKWKGIKDEWQTIKGKGRVLPADEIYERHNALVRDLRILMEMASYDSDLILDPDGASFFLINLIVRDLPRLTERIERLNALGSYALARERLGAAEKERLISVSGEVRGSIDTLRGDLDILTGQRGFRTDTSLLRVNAGIDMIISRSENYLKLVDARIIRAGKLDMPPWEFFNASTPGFFWPIYKTYDTSEAELVNIFSARTSRLARQSLTAWGVTIIIVAVVLYLLAGFYISVTDTVFRLGTATRQMSLTGLPETISLESRDELNEAVMFFNEVALALRRSHEVLLHSERLARIGSWDLDPVTGMMQWSPEMYLIYEFDPVNMPKPSLDHLFLKVHPDDARMVKDSIENGLNTGNIPLFEYRLTLNDGSIRHLSCEAEIRPYGIGRPASMTGFIQDITDRKKAEEEIREALRKVKQLSGLLPICASCKKIRNDKGYWESIERYIERHSEAEFSHSLCDDCVKKLYPNFHKKLSDAE